MVRMASAVYSLETEEPITVNKVRSRPLVRFSTDVRCFCNLPQCVSTGYMCKSSEGGCFFLSNLDQNSKDYRGRHGCLELIDKEYKSSCGPGNAQAPQEKRSQGDSFTFCCYHDMCNHVDSPQTKHLINNTSFKNEPIERDTIGDLQQPMDYSNSQVWFRAATIAVPLCGAVILFVLIALAVKILRSETQNSPNRKLGVSIYDHPSQSKNGCEKYDNILHTPHQSMCCQNEDLQRVQMPLLIQNKIDSHRSGNKNETNAKLNLMHGENRNCVLDIEKLSPSSEVNVSSNYFGQIADSKVIHKYATNQ